MLLCALVFGCSTDDKPETGFTTADQTTPRVLSEMNSFAEQVEAQRRYRYALQPNCTLKAERLLSGRPAQQGAFKIDSSRLLRFDYAPGLGHGLRAPAGRNGAMVSIFDAPSRDEIQTMEALIDSLSAACAESS